MHRPLSLKILSLTVLLNVAGVYAASEVSDATETTKTCQLDKSTLRKSSELFADAMMKYDPGPDVMLDMDVDEGCNLKELNCTKDKDDTIIEFVQDCRLVYYIPGQYKSNKQTGKRKVFSIRIRMAKNGKMSIVK